YTIVMRGGHQVQIPDKFEVTQITLTYEAAPGINVTLQISNIDIAATERANREPQGSFFKRAERQPLSIQAAPAKATNAPRARRTLTNLDLESTRRARLESEAAYERRRQELGLPSREESERRRQEETARARELFDRSEAATTEAESYWRERATGLRTEITALDAEIGYVRTRLAETPDSIATVSYGAFGSPAPYIFSAPAPPISVNRLSSGNRISLRVADNNAGNRVRPRSSFGFSNPHFGFRRRGYQGYATTYPYYISSNDRSELIARLRDMEARRAGLQARWRLLEDEARRAGAQPGWLRP
ncbi:MAG: hypothetical protein H7Y30_06600, partial [Pyrinomonadaceae bacterium]|nr:hypothetical protein [Pyrinomonadaceae bacterium]